MRVRDYIVKRSLFSRLVLSNRQDRRSRVRRLKRLGLPEPSFRRRKRSRKRIYKILGIDRAGNVGI